MLRRATSTFVSRLPKNMNNTVKSSQSSARRTCPSRESVFRTALIFAVEHCLFAYYAVLIGVKYFPIRVAAAENVTESNCLFYGRLRFDRCSSMVISYTLLTLEPVYTYFATTYTVM
jgi:hypothetical protein